MKNHRKQSDLGFSGQYHRDTQGIAVLMACLLGTGSLALAQSKPMPAPSTGPSITTASPEDAQAALVAAATANAVDRLAESIGQQPLGPGFTVADLITQADAQSALRQTLLAGQQIGGPRWITPQICQVRLDVPGAQVAQSLRQSIQAAGKRVTIPAATIEHGLVSLSQVTFSAIGSSTMATAADQLTPAADNTAWANVPDAARKSAIDAARQDAASRVIKSLMPIKVLPDRTLADALGKADSPARQSLEQYLLQRPISAASFGDDQVIRITLSASTDQILSQLRLALAATDDPALKFDDLAWEKLAEGFARQVASPTGQASAKGTMSVQTVQVTTGQQVPASALIPLQAPAWAGTQLTAEGASPFAGSALLTARAAERDAASHIASQVQALPLSANLTLSQAASQNPSIARVLDRAMINIRPYKAEYFPDGHVQIRAVLDLSDLWSQLHQLP